MTTSAHLDRLLYTASAFLALTAVVLAGCGHPILAALLLPGAVLGVVVGRWWGRQDERRLATVERGLPVARVVRW